MLDDDFADLGGDTLRGRLILLRAMEALSPLDESSLVLLAEHARVRRFRAGDVLLVEGRPIDNVYLVTSGQVTVTRKGKVLAVVTSGFGAGFTSLTARDPNGASAVADVDTQTLELPAEALIDTYERDFPFVRNVLRQQARSIVRSRSGLPADPDHPPEVVLGTWRDREFTLVERLMAAQRVPMLARANFDAVIEIVRNQVEVRFAPGDYLWRAGDPPSFSMRIDYGRVRCTTPAGRSVDIGSDYWIGTMDSFAGDPRCYDARAETPVIAYRADLEALLAVLDAHFDLALDFIALLARMRLGE
ncbi:MAG TPA: cyclic nucleotide-binding domain-containing protein [Kofleriaceae bacterium]|nr:cyclic nucleotide-binding domain-containing protein [Kofleriaceae bacterium]